MCTATASPGGQSCTYTVSTPETDRCTITGLTNGTAYTVTVSASEVPESAVSDNNNAHRKGEIDFMMRKNKG